MFKRYRCYILITHTISECDELKHFDLLLSSSVDFITVFSFYDHFTRGQIIDHI